MLKFGNKEFRNLEEQVGKNKDDIQALIDGVSAVIGYMPTIKGIYDTPGQIPSGTYNTGDTFLIGTATPYQVYVYTQDNKWKPIGKFPEPGPVGEKGEKGSQILYGNTDPTTATQANEGDYYINTTTGDWYVKGVTTWQYALSLKGEKGERGEQGIAGPQGPAGDTGAQGPKGDTGAAGDGIDTLNTVTFPYGAETVTYDTTDGITVNAQIQFEYDEDSTHQAAAAVSIPILAGDGISIDANESGDKVVIKSEGGGAVNVVYVDAGGASSGTITITEEQGKILTDQSGDTANVILIVKNTDSGDIVFTRTGSTSFTATWIQYRYASGISTTSPNSFYIANIQSTNPTKLSFYKKFIKTLFGNKNIIAEASGNIDLYRHVVEVVFDVGSALLTIISSKNIVIDSLTDLKTYLGNTFTYPCIGIDGQDNTVYQITQDKIYTTNQTEWSLTTATFSDTITTI